ncbi:MAG: hypothetical protein WBL68_02280 [Nitrososphaeraceae archaeon]
MISGILWSRIGIPKDRGLKLVGAILTGPIVVRKKMLSVKRFNIEPLKGIFVGP